MLIKEWPVSAVVASPTPGAGSPGAVRALQHVLYRAAKADPGRRFHALYDKVHRRDVMGRAWGQVRANNGAPGIDRITLADVEEYGVTRLLGELEAELKVGPIARYRPGGCSSRSRAATSGGPCRSLRSVTGSCKPR
jgi:RNA-directed DNA polymerase